MYICRPWMNSSTSPVSSSTSLVFWGLDEFTSLEQPQIMEVHLGPGSGVATSCALVWGSSSARSVYSHLDPARGRCIMCTGLGTETSCGPGNDANIFPDRFRSVQGYSERNSIYVYAMYLSDLFSVVTASAVVLFSLQSCLRLR